MPLLPPRIGKIDVDTPPAKSRESTRRRSARHRPTRRGRCASPALAKPAAAKRAYLCTISMPRKSRSGCSPAALRRKSPLPVPTSISSGRAGSRPARDGLRVAAEDRRGVPGPGSSRELDQMSREIERRIDLAKCAAAHVPLTPRLPADCNWPTGRGNALDDPLANQVLVDEALELACDNNAAAP